MIWEITGGLAGGLATVAVSEAVLRIMPGAVGNSLFHALGAGAALRALWVLSLLAWILAAGPGDPRLIVPSLMLGYLAAQVLEGIRYTRYFGRC